MDTIIDWTKFLKTVNDNKTYLTYYEVNEIKPNMPLQIQYRGKYTKLTGFYVVFLLNGNKTWKVSDISNYNCVMLIKRERNIDVHISTFLNENSEIQRTSVRGGFTVFNSAEHDLSSVIYRRENLIVVRDKPIEYNTSNSLLKQLHERPYICAPHDVSKFTPVKGFIAEIKPGVTREITVNPDEYVYGCNMLINKSPRENFYVVHTCKNTVNNGLYIEANGVFKVCKDVRQELIDKENACIVTAFTVQNKTIPFIEVGSTFDPKTVSKWLERAIKFDGMKVCYE